MNPIADMLASSNPLSHVVQHPMVHVGGESMFDGMTLLSNQILMQVVAVVLLLGLFRSAAVKRAGKDGFAALIPVGFANFIEVMCEYLRNEVAKPALDELCDRYIKYIWSVFFFVLTCNLLGLLPIDAVAYFVTGFKTHVCDADAVLMEYR